MMSSLLTGGGRMMGVNIWLVCFLGSCVNKVRSPAWLCNMSHSPSCYDWLINQPVTLQLAKKSHHILHSEAIKWNCVSENVQRSSRNVHWCWNCTSFSTLQNTTSSLPMLPHTQSCTENCTSNAWPQIAHGNNMFDITNDVTSWACMPALKMCFYLK